MKCVMVVTAIALGWTSTASAADVAFRKSKMIDSKQKQVKVDVMFQETAKKMVVRHSLGVVHEISYDAIDKLSYDFSKHRRVKQGAIVMIASLGAGAVVMLTKSKNHWLYIDHRKDGAAQTLTLKLDKGEYETVLAAASAHTGKRVERLPEDKK